MAEERQGYSVNLPRVRINGQEVRWRNGETLATTPEGAVGNIIARTLKRDLISLGWNALRTEYGPEFFNQSGRVILMGGVVPSARNRGQGIDEKALERRTGYTGDTEEIGVQGELF
ncbi:MAG: hypothetical protein Q8P57_05210 [Candidatus Pacearchaeota archaeon]|nr:hypothetical protein [Candidatus Pacearchaeota archaeon]